MLTVASSASRRSKVVCMDAPLNFNRQSSDRFEREGPSPEDSISLSEIVEQLTGFVRRQFPIFVFVFACAIALGLGLSLYDSCELYLARNVADRLQQAADIAAAEAPMGDVPIDTAQVETQVEILKSENIGLSVIKDLKLTEDPEFVGSGGGLVGNILGLLASPKVQSETGLTRQALGYVPCQAHHYASWPNLCSRYRLHVT